MALFHEGVYERDPIKRAILERRIGMIIYGHIGEKEPLSSHIRYNHQRIDSAHIFSAKAFGYAFGFREYEKFLNFKNYLDTPVDILEDLLEGYSRGTEDLLTEKKRIADKIAAEEKKKLSQQGNK